MSGLFPEDEKLPDPPDAGGGLFGESADAPAATAPARLAPAANYRVLARKYRPTVFEDLIGQDAMVRVLRNAFALGRVAHAFMLTGVRGVGKTTTARIIARALNCVGADGQSGPTADPCGICANCRAILADRHPDVLEMDAASRTGVDDVREIIEATRFLPLQARAKVFIIDEVHMLSRNAFNALLKTLEEPPAHVKFIFATTEIRKVPVTVLSRCQRFDLRRVSVAELVAHFARIAAAEQMAVAQDALDLIARAADGSVRDGLSLLDQAIAQADSGVPESGDAETATGITGAQLADMLGLADRMLVFDMFEAMMQGRTDAVLTMTDAAHARGADLGALLADLLDLTHVLTRLRAVPALRDAAELPEAERTRGAALAERLSVPMLGRAWQMLLKGVAEVETAPDRRAAAEMVLIRLCHVADLPPPGELVRQLAAARPAPTPGGGGALSRAGGAAPMLAPAIATAALPNAAQEAAPPRLHDFQEVLALAADQREAMLHSHLLHSVHLVRFAPPVIELRIQKSAPRDLVPRLAAMLQNATGTRWTIAISAEAGAATLGTQLVDAAAAREQEALEQPIVQAILAAFPGALVRLLEDAAPDRPVPQPAANPRSGTPMLETPADAPEFAPPDAEAVDFPTDFAASGPESAPDVRYDDDFFNDED